MAKLILGTATPQEIDLCMDEIDRGLLEDWLTVYETLIDAGWLPPHLRGEEVTDLFFSCGCIQKEDLKGLSVLGIGDIVELREVPCRRLADRPQIPLRSSHGHIMKD